MQKVPAIDAALLRRVVDESGQTGGTFAVGLGRTAAQEIVVVLPDGAEQTRQAGAGPWGTIWPMFQVAKRIGGQSAHRAFLAVRGNDVWIVARSEVAALLAETRTDRTDAGVAPELRPNDSLGIVPLSGRTFDPVLVYGTTPPAGVRFIGIELQDGVVAVIDGPGSPGSPVVNQRTLQHVTPLLHEALAVPGAGGLVVSTTTYQCWAVSSAAMDSIITRQAMPVQREASVAALDTLHDAMRYIPNGIHGVADKARRLAADPRPAPRAWAFTGFILALAMVILFGSILRTLSIGPHEAFIESTPGLNALAQNEFQASLFGITVTLGLIVACGPMILQLVGLLFSRAHTWAVYVFWAANGYDIAVGTRFWRSVFWPDGFESIYVNHGVFVGVLSEVGSVVVSGGLSLVTSVGMEFGLLLALTMAFALFGGAMAAIGMAVNQVCIRTPIRLIYAGRTAMVANRHYLDTQRQQYELPAAEPYFVVVDTPGYTSSDQTERERR